MFKSKDLKKKLGEFLKKERQKIGMSQAEAAKKFGYTSPQFVSNWERGLSAPPRNQLKLIAETYDIPKDQLIGVLIDLEEQYLKCLLDDKCDETNMANQA